MYTSYEELPIFLTVEELGKVLQIGRTKAYELVRSDKIQCIRAGNQYRIPKESIQNLCVQSVPSFS